MNYPLQFFFYLIGHFGQVPVIDRQHGGHRIYSRNFNFAIFQLLYNYIAGQHDTYFIFGLKGFVGTGRVARTKNPVFSEIHVQLFLQLFVDFDF